MPNAVSSSTVELFTVVASRASLKTAVIAELIFTFAAPFKGEIEETSGGATSALTKTTSTQ